MSICHRSITVLGALIVLVLSFAPSTQAQEIPARFAAVDYMHTENVSEYLEVEKLWKQLHQKLVEEGRMVYWGLYGVVYPTGTERVYNFATVRIYDDFSKIESPFPEDIAKAAYPNYSEEDFNNMMKRTGESRDFVRGEVFRLINTARGDKTDLGKYLQIDYMDVPEGGSSAYVEVENSFWKPIHMERISRELIGGWDLWGLMYPSGSNGEYDYATVNATDEFGKLAMPNYSGEIFTAAHPDASESMLDKMAEKTIKSRSLVRSHLWVRLDETTQ